MHPDDSRLHDYADDALASRDRAEVERHLDGCGECRQLVADLRELHRRIRALPPLEPPARAWRAIERAVRQDVVRPGDAWSAPPSRGEGGRAARAARYVRQQWGPWLAVAAVLLIAAAATMRLFAPAPSVRAPAASPTASGDSRDLAQSVQSELEQAVSHYQKAVNTLEQIKNSEKGALDAQTAATVEKSLATVDQAISESRAALKAQPNSEPAQQSLLESFKTKISVLEDTVTLINEMRKGNDAGAAKVISGLNQKS
jgi:anti-sigma factor RsiW